MIVQHLGSLSSKDIVLASQSPRRREILDLLGLAHRVVVSKFVEDLDKSTFATAGAYCEANAVGKAREVTGREPNANLVIGSDTIVVLDGKILEKPKSEGEAFKMLQSLSGRSHTVISAVAMFANGKTDVPVASFQEQTLVTFAELSDDAIAAYIRTGEPMDKGMCELNAVADDQ